MLHDPVSRLFSATQFPVNSDVAAESPEKLPHREKFHKRFLRKN